ncbi:MAG: AAA domain-containing protein [Bacteroidales bacterium]|nr:AAA domain-containing protein [Bacteroidales bacterium]
MATEQYIKPSVAKHFVEQRQLLQMEYEHEREEYKRISEQWGVERTVQRGLCWFPLRVGRNHYNSLNQLVVDVYRPESQAENEHQFEYGRQVRFFVADDALRVNYKSYTGTVQYVEGNRMSIAVPSVQCITDMENSYGELGVQLSLDETTYRTMFEALNDVAQARSGRVAELRDVICGLVEPSFREIYPVRFPWLNRSQEVAVNNMLCSRDVMIVHGPPGTGKTTTLVEAIVETLNREPQVLVCAQSNMAVDWISQKLVERGVNVLRIGNPTRVNDKMLGYCYERQYEGHPDYPELWSMRKTMRQLLSLDRKHSRSDAVNSRINRLRKRAEELEVKINMELFDNARVVASTLVGSNSNLLTGRHFSTLFVDEAGQALEAATWIAIRKAQRVVLAGDHLQLPPTIKCFEAERSGLSRTMMEMVVDRWPQCVTLLNTQYRMNSLIMQFPSDWFYGGGLRAAQEVEARGILDFDTPMEWIDTSELGFTEQVKGAGCSKVNVQEAEHFVAELEKYALRIGVERILDERIDFGLISPYKAQVQYMRRLVKSRASLRPLRGLLTIDTIDGFQGQERDVVFISLVRSNDDGKIGFLSDLRRMNVAITRARMKVVVIGNAATLSRHAFYRKLHAYITALKD